MIKELFLRVASIIPSSYVNGPGNRWVIHLQGCSLGCPGCFNTDTHRETGGELQSVSQVWDSLSGAIACGLSRGQPVEGITVSGGEPLQQPQALEEFLRIVKRKTSLSVILFSGYTRAEIVSGPGCNILDFIDILIDGRYDVALPASRGLLGSTNQTIHALTGRYKVEKLASLPRDFEVHVTSEGRVIITGFPPSPMTSDDLGQKG